MLAYFAFNCQVVSYTVQKDSVKPHHRQFVPDQRNLAISVLHLKGVFSIVKHYNMGVVVESIEQQQLQLVADF